MANIKISQLSELNKDQLTVDDQFIVNDSNSVTTRVGYGTIVNKIEESNLDFSAYRFMCQIGAEKNCLNSSP